MPTKLTTSIVAALALGLGLTVASAPARADKCDDQAATKNKDGKNFHIEYVNGKKVHVIDTVIAVCGKVPRPSVVYVLQAKTINYEWENLKQDFLPLVLASVKKAPF
ncbi:MAG: hypothetical protein H6709_19895 [Kofleriaceae bacterium]|nr:hypothetical protein [Myxococcales bacterium]MCB9559566.1 hypothetical protein [Kofleriaceae bacterium]MCB9574349.1 hypothetical protein [Kofleriaceae bacterium]